MTARIEFPRWSGLTPSRFVAEALRFRRSGKPLRYELQACTLDLA